MYAKATLRTWRNKISTQYDVYKLTQPGDYVLVDQLKPPNTGANYITDRNNDHQTLQHCDNIC